MTEFGTFRRRWRGAGLLVAVAALVLGVIAPTSDAPAQSTSERPAADSAPVRVPARRTAIRFLTDNDFPPFNYLDEDGTLVGLNIDLARTLCSELAALCDIQAKPWTELVAALKRGEADAVIAGHMITPSILRDVIVTDRYLHNPGRFVARRGTTKLETTPEGLDGKRIAVTAGTSYEAYVKTFFRDSRVQSFANIDLARDAIVTGAADVLFDDAIRLTYWLNGTASKACCEFAGGAFVEPRFFGDGIAILVRKDDLELRALLNGALKRTREAGRFDEILLRYLPLKSY
jgi:polar amino acid transport system substrate-binding protein